MPWVRGSPLKNCGECGSSVAESQKFCSECGTPLQNIDAENGTEAVDISGEPVPMGEPLACSKCGTTAEQGARFCFECGETLEGSRKVHKAEPIPIVPEDGPVASGTGVGLLGALWGGSASCGCGCFSLIFLLGLLILIGAFL